MSTKTSAAGKGAAGAWTAAILVIVLCLLATFTIRTPNSSGTNAAAGGKRASTGGATGGADGSTDQVVSGDQGSTGSDVGGSGGGAAGGGAAGTAGSSAASGAAAGKAGTAGRAGIGSNIGTIGSANCGGQNKASDTGVSATDIKFAAGTVTSGVAASFLADAQYGMEAVRNKVNRQGGVCGRQIKVDYVDDGWNSDTGKRNIESFIGEKAYFGLAVNPSSEGLKGAIDSHLIDDNKFPVIGSDGMLRDQYIDPWVWPVATSTASVMHIIAANAISKGAKSFGIVYDSHYRFGVEGFAAFSGELQRAGYTPQKASIDSSSGQQDFTNQAKKFVDDCGGTSWSNCQFVAMLLEPATADIWRKNGGMGDGQQKPAQGFGVPQPLFVNTFARSCGGTCDKMWAWTSFKPPIAPFDGDPAVATYKQDLANVNSGADANNPHVEGAYVGMLLLVDALTKAGTNPTRDAIRQILDSETLDVGLSVSPIKFSGGNHYGAVGAHAFQDTAAGNTFANWQYIQGSQTNDADVGKDAPA